jgi:hypothetical protein
MGKKQKARIDGESLKLEHIRKKWDKAGQEVKRGVWNSLNDAEKGMLDYVLNTGYTTREILNQLDVFTDDLRHVLKKFVLYLDLAR